MGAFGVQQRVDPRAPGTGRGGVVARSRRAGSAAPDDMVEPPVSESQDAEVIDPLQIASAGLEEVEEESPERPEADTGPRTQDPLTLLSLAIDEEEALAASGDVEEAPRRGLFGWRGRERTAGQEAQDDESAVPSDADTPKSETAEHEAHEADTPDNLFADEAPRVTTWAQDFEEFQTTGSMPAVTLDAGALADAAEARPEDDASSFSNSLTLVSNRTLLCFNSSISSWRINLSCL